MSQGVNGVERGTRSGASAAVEALVVPCLTVCSLVLYSSTAALQEPKTQISELCVPL